MPRTNGSCHAANGRWRAIPDRLFLMLSGRISIAGVRPLRVGCVGPLKFIARKRPSEFRFPDAVSRQCVLPTLLSRSKSRDSLSAPAETGDVRLRPIGFQLTHGNIGNGVLRV